MRFTKMRFVFCLLVTLSGCATSDLVKINDEYRILKEGGTMLLGTFRLATLKADALNEASDLCRKSDQDVRIIEELSQPVDIGVFARYELTFRCI
jgi:hypothetical protein